MCDYSLHNVKSRPAKVSDGLTVRDFGWGTRGFAASEDKNTAVCVLPGTELSFAQKVRRRRIWPWSKIVIDHTTAIFRQINRHDRFSHHDALEFPDGQVVLLTFLEEGQQATVLQLRLSGLRFCKKRPSSRSDRQPKLSSGARGKGPGCRMGSGGPYAGWVLGYGEVRTSTLRAGLGVPVIWTCARII